MAMNKKRQYGKSTHIRRISLAYMFARIIKGVLGREPLASIVVILRTYKCPLVINFIIPL